MKNKNKFLISCAVMAAAGVVLAMAGFAAGGRVYGIGADWKGLHVYAPALEEKNGDDGSDAAGQNEELPGEFDHMQIQAEYADIRIERTDGDAYSLSYHLPGYSELLKEVKDGKLLLTIQQKGSARFGQVRWFWFGFWPQDDMNAPESAGASITVYVPKDAKLSEAVLLTDSGDITCEGISADRLKMTDAYGDIDLLDLRAQEMQIKLESGRLKMERVEGGSCTVADEYGNASFAQVTLSGDMQVHMESGDVCFRDTVMRGLELKNAYGSVDGEQAVFGDMQISVESGDCTFAGLAFDSCSIRQAYGDVDLRLDRDVAEFGYELRTEYGEIQIDGKSMGEAYATLKKDQKPFLEVICESGNIAVQNTKS